MEESGAGSVLVTHRSGCRSGSFQKHTDPTGPYPDPDPFLGPNDPFLSLIFSPFSVTLLFLAV